LINPKPTRVLIAGHGAEAVRDAITSFIQDLPEHLCKLLIWDQGAEMAQHQKLKSDTGIDIYFCDPQFEPPLPAACLACACQAMIESSFATVRHLTGKTRGCLSRKTGLAMASKLMILCGTLLRNTLSGSGQRRPNGGNSTVPTACPK